MNLQIFTDPICLKELELDTETIPRNLSFPSNDEFCKRLSYLNYSTKEKLVVFSDAKKSFLLNQDLDNLKVVNDLILKAKTFEREVKSLIEQYTPHHRTISERDSID